MSMPDHTGQNEHSDCLNVLQRNQGLDDEWEDQELMYNPISDPGLHFSISVPNRFQSILPSAPETDTSLIILDGDLLMRHNLMDAVISERDC